MALLIYADFDTPDCYLAGRRATALADAGVDVDWRAVQRRPAPPVTGARLTSDERDVVVARFAELEAALLPGETLPRVAPVLAPNTESAVSAYAEAYGTAVADDVRRVLFDLYWCEGADIGNPNVLRAPLAGPMIRADAAADPMRQVGSIVSVSRGPVTTAAYRRIDAWRDEWRQLGTDALPVVLVDGATLVGLDAVRRLGKEMAYRGVDARPSTANPRRYPTVAGTPSRTWVSWVGGRWRHLYQSGVTS